MFDCHSKMGLVRIVSPADDQAPIFVFPTQHLPRQTPPEPFTTTDAGMSRSLRVDALADPLARLGGVSRRLRVRVLRYSPGFLILCKDLCNASYLDISINHITHLYSMFYIFKKLDGLSGYEPGGRRFESCRARHSF